VRTFVAVVAENNADLRPKQVQTTPVEAGTSSTRHKFSRTIWGKVKTKLGKGQRKPKLCGNGANRDREFITVN